MSQTVLGTRVNWGWKILHNKVMSADNQTAPFSFFLFYPVTRGKVSTQDDSGRLSWFHCYRFVEALVFLGMRSRNQSSIQGNILLIRFSWMTIVPLGEALCMKIEIWVWAHRSKWLPFVAEYSPWSHFVQGDVHWNHCVWSWLITFAPWVYAGSRSETSLSGHCQTDLTPNTHCLLNNRDTCRFRLITG